MVSPKSNQIGVGDSQCPSPENEESSTRRPLNIEENLEDITLMPDLMDTILFGQKKARQSSAARRHEAARLAAAVQQHLAAQQDAAARHVAAVRRHIAVRQRTVQAHVIDCPYATSLDPESCTCPCRETDTIRRLTVDGTVPLEQEASQQAHRYEQHQLMAEEIMRTL